MPGLKRIESISRAPLNDEEPTRTPRRSKPRSTASSSSLRSSSSSPRRGVGRTVSWSDDEAEVHTVKKIATRKKDKEALWFSPTEYKEIRVEAKMLAGLRQKAGIDITDSEEYSTRGLENMIKNGDLQRVIMAKQSVFEEQQAMYAFLSRSSAEKAQKLALQDARDAAAYQKEEASSLSTPSPGGMMKQRFNKDKLKGLRKLLPVM